ncbi:hypothetical protein M431DRAFT_486332 [Trichoderma harzianum CBS 226.95]|uniref:Helicase C-terminal domain-containing protein n=1 Tax=Trichoderma harzianum CBS 226.95 TaxID=983964 RepID=A0A2T3ZY88_TRIHA|nr:hypothetical protein M431DRAFT_486332 [Trichoderma harzianum CBS 226.95]PTB49784.1 hypothetical protein M431DRAFT_486332 [Trichoderma harzianum CBS 226.95]
MTYSHNRYLILLERTVVLEATSYNVTQALAKEYLSASHVRFCVGRAGSTTKNIKQIVIKTSRKKKNELFVNLFEEMKSVRTIIFINSRQAADTLDDFLYNMKLPVTSMHSDRTQIERGAAMRAFRRGQAVILVATGVTAGGIDLRYITDQVQDTLPDVPMTFVRCESQTDVHDQAQNTLSDVPMTFARCESQRDVHVFIPEAFDLDLVTTVSQVRIQRHIYGGGGITLKLTQGPDCTAVIRSDIRGQKIWFHNRPSRPVTRPSHHCCPAYQQEVEEQHQTQ